MKGSFSYKADAFSQMRIVRSSKMLIYNKAYLKLITFHSIVMLVFLFCFVCFLAKHYHKSSCPPFKDVSNPTTLERENPYIHVYMHMT